MKKVLFVVTSATVVDTRNRPTGYEFSEVAHPYLALKERGYEVDFASPSGGAVPEDGYNETDQDSRKFRKSDAFERLNESAKISDVDLQHYEALFFPGGIGPKVDLAHDRNTKALVIRAVGEERIIGAVCHGSAALIEIPTSDRSTYSKGRRVSFFTRAEELGHSLEDVPFLLDDALRNEGAIHTSVAPLAAHVEIDGNLVTGQNPASARGVGNAIAYLIERYDPQS